MYKNQDFFNFLYQKNHNIVSITQTQKVGQKVILEYDLNRLIEMAWQDRVSFDIIQKQYGLSENQLKNKMRALISHSAFKRWRKRVKGRVTKHASKLEHKPNRFQGPW
nr:TIGR03643 family protein [uncultured Sulfurimonas sp.]